MRILRRDQGFTLVELMLVVIIIGVLVAMVAPRLTGRSRQAREAAAQADINAHLSAALDLFEVDNGRFPTTGEGMESLRTAPSGVRRWKGPYLKKVPLDPWDNEYIYEYPGKNNERGVDILSMGPDGRVGGDDDITNWE